LTIIMAELVNNAGGGDSQESRIAYLRERGVEIEFPEDRLKDPTSASSQEDSAAATTTTSRKVYLVKIPCDDKEPLTEIQLPVSDSDSKSGDQLLELLRIFFRSKKYESPGVVAELKKNTPTYFGNADISVSDETLQNLTLQGNVEAFALTRPTEASGYSGVTLYLDEVGQLKKLPLNRRAAAIATDCGYDNVPLAGDMFIARTRMAPPSSSSASKMRHENFRLTDLDSTQQWIRAAKADNYNAAAAVGRISMEGGGEPDGSPQPGRDREGRLYRWRESPDGVSVDVTLPLPADTTSKQLAVTFRSSVLTVKTKTGTVLLHIDPLAASCDPDDCTWTFTAGETPEMELSLIKANAGQTWGSLERK
jgi:hypothetical protein